MSWRVLAHTADSGAEIEAPDLEGLFADAARALVTLVLEEGEIQPRETVEIRLAADDLPSLLVAWLSELLFLVDTRGFLASWFRFRHLDGTTLEAEVLGEPLDPERHGAGREVKAVTWHDLAVEPGPAGWTARVLFDL